MENNQLEQKKILEEVIRLRKTFNEILHNTGCLISTDPKLEHFTETFNVQFFMGGDYREFFYQDLIDVLDLLEEDFQNGGMIQDSSIAKLCPIDTRIKFNQVSHFFADICLKRDKYENFYQLRSDTVILYYETLLYNLLLDIERRVK